MSHGSTLSKAESLAVNFRMIAEKLGGSTIIVTHYYGTREELLNDILVQRSTEGWQTQLSKAGESGHHPG